jgi:hypothetical protein
MAVITVATITCPECGVSTRAEMPTDACQFFWTCPACEKVIRPLPGDCYVFCSCADQRCPAEAVRRRLLLAGFFRLDLRDHQDIAVGIGQLHLLRRPRGSVLDLAGVDPVREQLLAQRGQVV